MPGIDINLNAHAGAQRRQALVIGVDPHALIPTFQFISADELTESLNAFITAVNSKFRAQGLSAAQDIRLFYSLDPSQATLALNTVAEELNANLALIFGS